VNSIRLAGLCGRRHNEAKVVELASRYRYLAEAEHRRLRVMVTLDMQRFREVPPASYKKWDDPREVGGIKHVHHQRKRRYIHERGYVKKGNSDVIESSLARHFQLCPPPAPNPPTGESSKDKKVQIATTVLQSEAVQSSLQTPCISKINRRRHIGFSTFRQSSKPAITWHST